MVCPGPWQWRWFTFRAKNLARPRQSNSPRNTRMTRKSTAEALERSIRHHKRLLACKTPAEVDIEGTTCNECALCQLFYRNNCEGCPVKEESGMPYCDATPFEEEIDALVMWEYGTGTRDKFRHAVREEIKFLESLRTTGATK